VSLLPSVRSTWAPRGKTPLIRHRFSWSKLSMAAALAYRWDKKEAAMVFALQDEAYDTATLIEFLEDFHCYFKGEKITLIWDRLSAHHSAEMLDWIYDHRHWLVVEELPPYAHELNPCELVWGNVKGWSSSTCAPRPWRRRAPPRPPDSSVSGWTPRCASTSSSTPVFLYDNDVIILPKCLLALRHARPSRVSDPTGHALGTPSDAGSDVADNCGTRGRQPVDGVEVPTRAGL
jgi:DDE superfamily endonuclease